MLQDDLGGFGDARLRRVGAKLLDAMCQKPTTCIHALADDRNQELAFGRFLDHGSVSFAEMLTATGRFTGRRAAGRHVLAIQDTTEFNFPRHTGSKRGFGRSGNDRDLGLFLHPTIAVDGNHGGIIGLVGAQVLNRTGAKVDASSRRAIEDKESYRWLLAAEEAADVLAGAACITVVADRESDIYEQFARRPAGVHLLTRTAQDRCLPIWDGCSRPWTHGPSGIARRLSAAVALLPLAIGMLIHHVSTSLAMWLRPSVKLISNLAAVAVLVACVVVFGRGLIVVAGSLAVAAQFIFFALITTLPYWIGFGLPHNQKIVLSCGMATRNLGVALAPLFSLVEVDQRAIVMVVLALPISIAFAFGAGWLFRPRADFSAS